MKEKTCSECGYVYPESLCYRSNITGLTLCANCVADIRHERETNLRFPVHVKPSIIEARKKQKEKRLKSSSI